MVQIIDTICHEAQGNGFAIMPMVKTDPLIIVYGFYCACGASTIEATIMKIARTQ